MSQRAGEDGFGMEKQGITVRRISRNAPPARLYEAALLGERAAIVAGGALATFSGIKTGRSPRDKRLIEHPTSKNDIWWGEVNIPLEPHSFAINRQRALDYLNTRDLLYVVDGYAGWDPHYRVKVRVICSLAYHALFMRNMLICPTTAELASFGEPDFLLYNAGEFPANPYTTGMTSRTSIALHLEERQMVVLGSMYAGEMKKGIFTYMHYLMPKQGVLSMHCSANEGASGDIALFFGLSGTGKTTLSADPHRCLIGDDEHCWSDHGIFNIEGGCYAKCVDLTAEREPEIYQAIRFGTVLENVVFEPETRQVDFSDISITENTRACYPIEYIANAKLPCVGGHPRNIIFLTADAFGVLPPVAKLTSTQAMYHFISGYTAKVAGTEMGVQEPQATFSACFGAAFLVWHPGKYATLLAEKMQTHHAHCWLVNTGWTGGLYGVGSRMKLAHTRAIIDAIHSGELERVAYTQDPLFGFQVPKTCPNVPAELLWPKYHWRDQASYDPTARKLAQLFAANFTQYADSVSAETLAAGPRL